MSERILKVEHIAEAITFKFFEVFLDSKEKIRVFDAKEKRVVKLSAQNLRRIVGKEPKTKAQFEVKSAFEVSSLWKERNGLKGRKITIDRMTCFDCALEANKKVMAIEVKSGISGRFKSIDSILKYSLDERKVEATNPKNKTVYLKGDMISILASEVLSPTSSLKLVKEWILVVRSHPDFKNIEGPLPQGLRYIMTLKDMTIFLEGNGLKNMKDKIWDDFKKCVKEIQK